MRPRSSLTLTRSVSPGASAGGGLCAALALLARDRGKVPLQFQLLDCPMIDDRQITPSSQLDELLVWTKASNAFGWQCYLGDLYGADDIPYTAAAARADDLSGLPEAYVCVGGRRRLSRRGHHLRHAPLRRRRSHRAPRLPRRPPRRRPLPPNPNSPALHRRQRTLAPPPTRADWVELTCSASFSELLVALVEGVVVRSSFLTSGCPD